jgi:ABC-type lipoprotein release transport system permease subunit
MRAPWFVARTQLRQRSASAVVLTLIVGIAGAVVLASLAGARRTSNAMDRFRDETRAPDLTVFLPPVDAETIDGLRSLRGVEGVGVARQLMATVNGQFSSALGGPLDDKVGRSVDRVRVLEGRRPDPDRVHEVAIPDGLAQATGLSIGDSIRLHGFTQEQIDEAIRTGSFDIDPAGPLVRLRVVGVTRSPSDLSFEGSGGGVMFTTPAFVARYADEIGSFSGSVLRVRTANDAAARRFVEVARQRTADLGAEGEFQVQPRSETEGAVRESIDVVAQGLFVFAVVAALAGVVVVGIVIRRFVDGGADDLDTLRALGIPREERTLTLALGAMPVAVAGSLVAVLGAWLASPIMPLGLARTAEPDLGLHVDALVLGAGFFSSVILVALLALWSAHSAVRTERTAAGTAHSTLAPVARLTALPPAVAIGVGTAFESGRRRASTSPWPAVGGALVAVIGVVAVGVVAASMRNLEHEPRVYGYNWDAHVIPGESEGAGESEDTASECDPAELSLVRRRAVAGAAVICSDVIEVNGYPVTGIGFRQLKGRVSPTVLDGRAPSRFDEVALATKTLDRVGAHVGDSVRIAGPGGRDSYHVVGRVVLPSFTAPANEDADVQAIADGAALTGAGLEAVAANDVGEPRVAVRWRGGVDTDAAAKRVQESGGRGTEVLTAIVPFEVDRLEQVHLLPWILGAFVALIGVLGLGYGLVISVRRRSRELAVLKTIGFRHRQVMGTVGAQATVYAALGLLAGVPVGYAVGRAAWSEIADSAGFDVVAILPWWFVAVVVVGTLLAANAVAWFPGRRAARLRPAVVLRSE